MGDVAPPYEAGGAGARRRRNRSLSPPHPPRGVVFSARVDPKILPLRYPARAATRGPRVFSRRGRPPGWSARSEDGRRVNRWVVAVASVVVMAGLGSFNAWSV